MIDFAGPWEVFQDVNIPGRAGAAFRLYTVAATPKPIHVSGGMKIVPDYTIANAPAPKVIVIPAQSPLSEATKQWIRKATRSTDVTMSVCTGAFALASTGLLQGPRRFRRSGSSRSPPAPAAACWARSWEAPGLGSRPCSPAWCAAARTCSPAASSASIATSPAITSSPPSWTPGGTSSRA